MLIVQYVLAGMYIVHCICTCRVVLCADWLYWERAEGWELVVPWALLAERERKYRLFEVFACCFSLIKRDAGLVVGAEVRHWLEIVQCRCLYWGLLAGHCADRVISVCCVWKTIEEVVDWSRVLDWCDVVVAWSETSEVQMFAEHVYCSSDVTLLLQCCVSVDTRQ